MQERLTESQPRLDFPHNLQRVTFTTSGVESFSFDFPTYHGIDVCFLPEASSLMNVVCVLQDGSRGDLESLATRYADELRTHYKDVLARLEDIRRRRVAIDFPPLPPQSDSLTLKTSRSFKPGKYSPSSCLSDHEEESIYCLYEVPPPLPVETTPSSDPLRSSKPRCLSPRSRYFYEPCPFPAADSNSSETCSEHSKKRGPLGRLFRSLGPKKDRDKSSPQHKCAKPQHQHQLNVKYLAEGSRLQIGDVGEEDQVRLLLQLVKDGFISMEDAMDRIQPRETEKHNDIHERIEDCPNHLGP
ncbi:uncharacterized protein CDAR_497481 [Caerostris darwini]|uniref:Uncharacterized protein n=1 Tax=Caerostris darwini TaxID=1538125 RepID=A0AAV4S0A7_9ARAC|nr:uncharacterized protein CDAR_497481 [Caerostris darwini]